MHAYSHRPHYQCSLLHLSTLGLLLFTVNYLPLVLLFSLIIVYHLQLVWMFNILGMGKICCFAGHAATYGWTHACMHCNEWPGMKDEKRYYNEEIWGLATLLFIHTNVGSSALCLSGPSACPAEKKKRQEKEKNKSIDLARLGCSLTHKQCLSLGSSFVERFQRQ